MNRAWFKVWITLVALSTTAVADRLLHPNHAAVEQFGSFNDKRLAVATEIQPKIVGGVPAKLNEFPYFAQWAGYFTEGSTTYFGSCGASLIHADILLTAAHCNDAVDRVLAVVGSYYQLSSEEGYLRNVTGRSIHPSYSDTNLAYDFLVLKLISPVPTPVVTLNSNSSSPITNERLTIAGLGRTTFDGTSPPALLKVDVNYVDPVTCYNVFRKFSTPIFLNTSLHLCAGVSEGGKNSCKGDSGGPVLNAKGVQVGVVSFGEERCALPGYPGVNARVSGGLAWIQQQVCALSAYPPPFCFKRRRNPTNVRLDVFFDSNPTVTRVIIYDSNSTKVYTAGPGKTKARNKLVSWNVSFTPGYYYMQLSNSFCCSQGDGFIAAYALVNGRYIPITGPYYAYYEGIYSNVSMPVPVATSTPVNYTGPGTAILVEVNYDKYPVETSFAIYNSKKQVVFSSGLGKSEFAYELISYNLTLVPGNYSIKIGDTFKDGFCCSSGIGYVAVSALKKDGSYQVLIPPTYGLFSAAVKSIPFYVATPTRRMEDSAFTEQSMLEDSAFTEQSMLPLASYSILTNFCQDSGLEFSYNASVNVHAKAGKQTCRWLANQPELKKVVCQPHQEAYKLCPKTCGKCFNECEGQDDATAIFEVEHASHDCAWLSAHSEFWLTACVPGLPAYNDCKDVCNSCGLEAEGSSLRHKHA